MTFPVFFWQDSVSFVQVRHSFKYLDSKSLHDQVLSQLRPLATPVKYHPSPPKSFNYPLYFVHCPLPFVTKQWWQVFCCCTYGLFAPVQVDVASFLCCDGRFTGRITQLTDSTKTTKTCRWLKKKITKQNTNQKKKAHLNLTIEIGSNVSHFAPLLARPQGPQMLQYCGHFMTLK